MEKKNTERNNNRGLDEKVNKESEENVPKSDKELDPENPPKKNDK